MPASTFLPPVGVDQCRYFLKGLTPKNNNYELWVKFGHDSIYRAQWDDEGNLSGTATALTDKDNPSSRVDKGKPIPNLLKHLHNRSQKEDGGVFFVPTQPIGNPMADCVESTDDIGVEMDHLSIDDQKSVIADFERVTGIEFASVLSSGGASIHAHIKTEQHFPVEDMMFFRRMAVISFQSDPVTVRLHQPMRLPGFYRKEKASYQELLSLSDRRYSMDDLSQGFQKWFEYKGWIMPDAIEDAWWNEGWRPLLASSNSATPSLKQGQTVQFLAEGNTGYLQRRKAESEQRRIEIAQLPNIQGDKISDLVKSCCDRATIGDFSGVNWQGGGGHYRGQCPFHEGKSGNSAWLSDASGSMRFHCSSCTGDAPRSSFEYMLAKTGLTHIDDHHGLKGKDYVKAAEAFLAQYGVSLPKVAQKPPATFELSEPIAEDKVKSLENEFELIKTKYDSAYQRVESLTREFELAEGEEKKQIAIRLKNAKDIMKSLGSSRFNTRLELKNLTSKQKSEAETGFAKDFIVIQEKIADRLSYNILEKSIYIDSEPTVFNSACLWLYEKTGHINWNKSDATLSLLILDFAKKNEFCPVKRYLESIEPKVSHYYLDQCIPYVFGITEDDPTHPLAIAAFKAQLVGSVRRIYEPGCHHRLMPILFGQQKKGKSTFIRALYGEFSSAGMLPMADKDGAMIIQRCWAHEVDECDKLFRTREASSLKSFVALTKDTFRAPYERDTLSHPRRSVLWGTTNHQALFSDPTGNTRYPVIAMPDNWSIPTDWVAKNRDNIWAAALDAYWSGVSNEIPHDLEKAISDDAENYIDKDALFEPIQEFLLSIPMGSSVTLMEVGKKLGYQTSSFNKPDQNRVTAIMRSLGWDNKSLWHLGKKARRWVKTEH